MSEKEQMMVERMAEAIYGGLEQTHATGFDEKSTRLIARAAIEAMKVPTPAVLQALEHQLDRQGHDQTVAETWALLLDAALQEKP